MFGEIVLTGGQEGFVEGTLPTGGYAALTVGNHRHSDSNGKPVNQDGVLVKSSGKYTILAVADGVSSAKDAHLGSKCALEKIAELDLSGVEPDGLDAILAGAFSNANKTIKTMIAGSSTTLLVAVVWNAEESGLVKVYNLGDCALYHEKEKVNALTLLTTPGLFRPNTPFQLDGGNSAPSYINRIFAQRSSGPMSLLTLENLFTIKAGEKLIVTTDGLKKAFSEEIYTPLMKGKSPAEAVRAILRKSGSFEGGQLDPDSVSAGRPNTRKFRDDLGFIVYEHRLN
ncbi:protein phosphatase 2C domain-containing protein [Candidatus Woesearchaeota archaeon]|nr:protein phosphatase 2C domain-containing protein [Candidatus Woesearchaeota archaeon]